MPLRVVETLPSLQEISHLWTDYFTEATLLGRDLEQEAMEGVLKSGAQNQKLLSLAALDEHPPVKGILLSAEKPWEAQFFGCKTVMISLLVSGESYSLRFQNASTLLTHWLVATCAEGRQYVTVRIPANDFAMIHSLERAGFHLLVPTVTFAKSLMDSGNFTVNPAFEVSPFQDADLPIIEKIARSAFIYGRFWVEPDLDNATAGEMHATWVRNCCSGDQAEAVLVARSSQGPLGFIAIKRQQMRKQNLGSIVLIAVSSEARGRGVGQALVQAGCAWMREQGVGIMVVRTEMPNIAAIRLYERQGFTVENAGIYYGRWNNL